MQFQKRVTSHLAWGVRGELSRLLGTLKARLLLCWGSGDGCRGSISKYSQGLRVLKIHLLEM